MKDFLALLKREANKTETENGAVTYRSTKSECLDFFSCAGALRYVSDQEVVDRFIGAWSEDPDLSMRILFFARDIRRGLGERRTFRLIIKYLAVHAPDSVRKNLPFFSEFGRYDDLLVLMGTPVEKDVIELIGAQLQADKEALTAGKAVSLLGKWLPSVNASSKETVRLGKRIAKALGMSEAEYRRTLVALREKIRIIENPIREKDYTFEYSEQPSRALMKYRKAFERNDRIRYHGFLNDVREGSAKMNTSCVLPHEIVTALLSNGKYRIGGTALTEGEAEALETTWAALPDYGGASDSLAVIDTSGSMYCRCGGSAFPAAVAISLGLYFAERNKGAFANHFISFSETPQLIEIKGRSLKDRVNFVESKSEIANTNIEAVFDLLLKVAVKNRLPSGALPKRLFIISDMEFDRCADNASATNFEQAKKKFGKAGYALPQIVFWNVASRNKQVPVEKNEQGVILVSGFSPMIFSMVTEGDIDPYAFMLQVINNERYLSISA
ncbi:MAG: DUF2828 family protein [Clostridiales bacterium]|nr:DUF2828 family protein [Clostridiales bacterium]